MLKVFATLGQRLWMIDRPSFVLFRNTSVFNLGVVWIPSSPPDHTSGLRRNHQWTALERLENKDMHKYLLHLWNGAKELKRQGIIVSIITYWTDVFIVQTKILLFFVANLFIVTIFLSFLTWLIFMDNSFPHMQNGSNNHYKKKTHPWHFGPN